MSTLLRQNFTDEELVFEIVSKNNTQLFAVLYDRFWGVVFHKCYSFSRNKEEAEDLTHDIFIRLFSKLESFKGTSKFSTWLYSFTYNFCVNYVQRDSNKKKQKLTIVKNEIKESSDVNSIEHEELLEFKTKKLEQAMAQIAPKYKSILLMKYQEDMSIKEIQNLLNIGESAVKMRIKRAKEKVAFVYDQLENGFLCA